MAHPATQPPITVQAAAPLVELLGREWLRTNAWGSYASSTVLGCNTRRYHGLLVAATAPPVGRVVALSTLREVLTIGERSYDLSTFEFPGTFAPRGAGHLTEFRDAPAATFVFQTDQTTLVKEVLLAEAANAVIVRYTLGGLPAGIGPAGLELWPFVALRDFHHLRKVDRPHQMTFESGPDGVTVQDRAQPLPSLHVAAAGGTFAAAGQWWYGFCYREEMARGQEGQEDLYTPGSFSFELADGQSCELRAGLDGPPSVGFAEVLARRQRRQEELAASVPAEAAEATRRLAVATDAFVVRRHRPDGTSSPSILAGYHWFADWGRDAFVALPGLLLATGRLDEARGVFRTFAERISEGMVPNRFDDYSSVAHYNSIDASLWFIIAAERYRAASGDADFWSSVLLPAARAILSAYQDGTRFDIRADADGLLAGGARGTQLTWMDAALGDEVVTPRHGKAVEVNALWHSAHAILARRLAEAGDEQADHYADRADRIAAAFARAFWNERCGCLYDCLDDGEPDASLRPNQILAVSLPHSPLPAERQAAVVRTVREHLLTPLGLRSLAPGDPRYRGRYAGSWETRDRSYHQGTVWAWLMGPFVEAYLKLNAFSEASRRRALAWLEPFDAHLREAGIGFISEIFDGDPPHRPRGCIAQAWSVAEVLRARRLAEAGAPEEAQ